MSKFARTQFNTDYQLVTAECSDPVLDRLISNHFPVLSRSALDIVRAFLRYELRQNSCSENLWQDLCNLELEAAQAEMPVTAHLLQFEPLEMAAAGNS